MRTNISSAAFTFMSNVRLFYSLAMSFLLLCCQAVAAQGNNTDTQPGPQISEGRAQLSGSISADSPLKAVKIRALNLDKRVMYMVFSSRGRYRALGLLPGRYEITVQKSRFSAPAQSFDLAAGQHATADFKLASGATPEFLTRAEFPKAAWQNVAEYQFYDVIYPNTPTRRLIKEACMSCHNSETFLPAHPRSQADWSEVLAKHARPTPGPGEPQSQLSRLLGGTAPGAPLIGRAEYSDRQWSQILQYLSSNFGPGPMRGVKVDPKELPLDEESLGKAMYIEYYLPLDPKLDATNNRRQAQDPHVDRNGNVWYTDNGYPARVGMLNPNTAEFTDYLLQSPRAYPHGITVDANNNVWWSERDAGYIGMFDQGKQQLHFYPSDPTHQFQGPWWVHTPVVDSENNVWFSDIGTNAITKWDAKNSRVGGVWRYPTATGRSYGMAVDSSDNIWIAEHLSCTVARFSPKTEQFVEYRALQKRCAIRRLTVDRDGVAWYGGFSAGTLGRIEQRTGKIQEIRIPARFSSPYDVQAAPDGTIWIGDGAMGGALVHYNPQAHAFSYYPTPQLSDIPRMDIAPDGSVWYAARTGPVSAVGVLYFDVSRFAQLER